MAWRVVPLALVVWIAAHGARAQVLTLDDAVAAALSANPEIFQGLAIWLMAGEVASLLLSRMAVPVMYHLSRAHQHKEAVS
ncbi:MAG: hypothetical protein FJW14_17660 [Acidimicrobiia bacterium]|nr:hypothetical protein [Acidimicrobiia bacterium]